MTRGDCWGKSLFIILILFEYKVVLTCSKGSSETSPPFSPISDTSSAEETDCKK